jgi:hypothetical protein
MEFRRLSTRLITTRWITADTEPTRRITTRWVTVRRVDVA